MILGLDNLEMLLILEEERDLTLYYWPLTPNPTPNPPPNPTIFPIKTI